ncbi:hypothetical protein HPY42_05430 [Coprothermobacteraceae bacterium]|nr:hypothetical protein [Coprothermobacteraceae bacterium]
MHGGLQGPNMEPRRKTRKPTRNTQHLKMPAFTLVELLIILLILGILIGIAIPRYLQAVESSKQRVFCANVRTVVSAVEAWRIQEGSMLYPSLATVNALVDSYFAKAPTNPYTGTKLVASGDAPTAFGDFQYILSTDASTYTVSTLPACGE